MVGRFRKAGPDSNAGGLDPEPVMVHRCESFSEDLREPVKTVRTRRGAGIEQFCLPVEPDCMVGTGEFDTLDAVLSCRFVEVDHAIDVGPAYDAPRRFDRLPAHVNDAVTPLHQGIDFGLVAKITSHDFSVRLRFSDITPA